MTRNTQTTSTRRAAKREKRGTVLIFAVGALAVIAIIAVSYVSVVRIERNSAAAVTSQSNLGDSIDIVANEIKAVLAADLFGNKIVTPATPRFIGAGTESIRVYPRMFEDGEFSDYPSVDGLDTSLTTMPTAAMGYTFDSRFFGDPDSPPSVSRGNSSGPSSKDPWVLDEDLSITMIDTSVFPGIGRRFETAAPDDAWLATTEPEYHNPGIDEMTSSPEIVWRNITNLRSAYRWVEREQNTQLQLWVRGDGRFADLAEFFNTDTNLANQVAPPSMSFGNAGRNINVIDPEFGSVHHEDGAELNNTTMLSGTTSPIQRTGVYEFQMAFLGEMLTGTPGVRAASSGSIVARNAVMNGDPNFEQLDAIDERWWVDTDGDLRPDARWQQIDALGNLGNLIWVVGTRIIDASSLVNVNTAISFDQLGSAASEQFIGDGRTPADIDLFRQLDRSGQSAGYYSSLGVDTSRLGDAFTRSHISRGLGLTEFGRPTTDLSVYDELTDPMLSETGMPRILELPYIGSALDVGNSSTRAIPNRALRSAFYEFASNSPQDNDLVSDVFYPLRDIYDLMSFWGTNHSSTITKLEQRLDGPDSNPYYPQTLGDYRMRGSSGPFGPIRSIEDPTTNRRYSPSSPQPGFTELRNSTRNSITTISGVANFSPVPVLNDDPSFENLRFREKVNLRELWEKYRSGVDMVSGRSPLNGEDIKPVLEAFVWALAPFATDQPYTSDLAEAQTTAFFTRLKAEDYHYGGGSGGSSTQLSRLAEQIFVNPEDPSMAYGSDPGPGVALMTAASLTANLIDAIDGDEDIAGVNLDYPTVLRIFPRMNKINHLANERQIVDNINTIPIEMDLNFAHGEVIPFIANATLPLNMPNEMVNFFGDDLDNTQVNTYLNDPSNNAENGIVNRGLTVVGLESQPFLTDAFSMSFYTDTTVDSAGANSDGVIQPNEQLGSFFAVKLFNPWPQTIEIDESFQVVIPDSPTSNMVSQLNPDGVPADSLDLRFTLPTGTISAGQEVIFYWALGVDAAPWNDTLDGGSIGGDIEQAIVDAIAFDTGITPVLFGAGPTGDPMAGTPRTAVMFQDLSEAGTSLPVLLVRSLSRTNSASDLTQTVTARNNAAVTQTRWLLIDRIRNTAGNPFPATVTTPVELYTQVESGPALNPRFDDNDLLRSGFGVANPEMRDNTGAVTGRLMVMSSVSRPRRNGMNGGWPTSVIERPSENISSVLDGSFTVPGSIPLSDEIERSYFAQIWLEEGAPGGNGDPGPAVHPKYSPVLYLFLDDGTGILDPSLDPSILRNSLDVGGPQHFLNVGNIAGATSDPLVPSFQLYCPNRPLNTVGEIGQISIFAHTCSGHNLTRLDQWVTASERMGLAMRTRRNGNTTPDPYFAVLDPTRYMFGGNSNEGDLEPIPMGGAVIPANLTVPLATRVYDCFEALNVISDIKQGVINVNTASARVLELLPFIKPRLNYPAPTGSLPNGSGAASMRANMIVEYRDRVPSREFASSARPTPDFTLLATADPSGLGAGLRDTNRLGEGGIAAIGELALMDNWNAAMGNPTPGTNGFGFLGNNSMNDGFGVSGPFLSAAGNFLDPSPGTQNIDPTDDPEERSRVFSAVSNLATTRSDIFLAWTVIRGYDPDEIERIQVAPGNEERSLLELDPTFDRRYLLVLDRSNVREPTDRPRVLLRFRLPDVN